MFFCVQSGGATSQDPVTENVAYWRPLFLDASVRRSRLCLIWKRRLIRRYIWRICASNPDGTRTGTFSSCQRRDPQCTRSTSGDAEDLDQYQYEPCWQLWRWQSWSCPRWRTRRTVREGGNSAAHDLPVIAAKRLGFSGIGVAWLLPIGI